MAVRRLVREPLFAITAIVTLGIGIGANSAIFTLVNGVLLRPLPFAAPSELVMPHAVLRGEGYNIFSSPVFLALREHATTLSDVALFSSLDGTFADGGDPQRVTGAAISANYFAVTGMAPLLGRTFRDGENEPGSNWVVLLSEGLWRERFSADTDIVGRMVEINSRPYEVVGVMPAAASFPPEWRFWVPQQYTPGFVLPGNVLSLSYSLVARLAPGVSMAQASADVARVVEMAKTAGDLDNPYYSGAVKPLRDVYVQNARTPLLVLLGAVGLVLLIVCANIANLLLAQAASRTSDFAVRQALGASSGQLIRQLMTESVVLGLAGGAAGLLIGMWGADALLAMLPPGLPSMPYTRLDGAVVVFTFAISLGAALLFGLAPAMHARRTALAATLRQGGRGLVSRGGTRTRAGLVLAETALAFALVIGAGLLIRSLGELRDVDPGFRTADVLSFEIALPTVRYDTEEAREVFWAQLTERLNAVPGVVAAGGINNLPLAGSNTVITFDVEGRPPVAAGEESVLDVRIVTPGLFAAMDIPLRAGRLFTGADRAGAPPVALLSEAAAARHFPGENPIGQRIIMGWTQGDEPVQGEIVGIVGNVRHSQLRNEAQPEIYFPAAQVSRGFMTMAVRTAGAPASVAGAVRNAVHELDGGLAIGNLRTLDDVVAASVATDRFVTMLLTVFSLVALLLAAIGIFGVISYGVAQRRREIGVRMAVGASRSDVVRMIVVEALHLAGGGVLIGALGALALTRMLQSLLFGVRPTDPVTFTAAGTLLLLVALLASMLPAVRAARTPPASILNSE